MGTKNENDKAYDKGYNEGKKADMLDQFAHSVKDIIPVRGATEDSQDAGYKDGVRDKNDSKNSNYKGRSSK